MKNEVLKTAIMYPHKFPWREEFRKKKINIKQDELNKILIDAGLDDRNTRRIIEWEIDRLIFTAALKANDLEHMIEIVKMDYQKLAFAFQEASDDLVKSLAARKDLNENQKIKLYKAFINGNLSKLECSKNSTLIANWIVELMMFYLYSNKTNTKKSQNEIIKMINEQLKEILYEDSYNEETIVSKMKRNGFSNQAVGNIFSNHFCKYVDQYKDLLVNINILQEKDNPVEEKEVGDFDIASSLFGMYEEIQKNEELDEGKSEIDEKNEKQAEDNLTNSVNDTKDFVFEPKVENAEIIDNEESQEGFEPQAIQSFEENEEICKIDQLKQSLEDMADILGYKLVSKEQHEKMIIINESKEKEFFKKLVNISEGAIFSELYNLYRSSDEVDQANLEAILGNVFSMLLTYGLEIDDEEGFKVGDEIEVDSKDILRTFIVSSPINKDGKIRGIIKYPGWKYKNQIIMPMVITPNE